MTVYMLAKEILTGIRRSSGRAFIEAGVDAREWLLIEGEIDLDGQPPERVFYNRLSASSHTRNHPWTKDYARASLTGWKRPVDAW
ncbi:MAG: hypothetical protein R2843_01590 [Thermomicrobiales bacterium]